MKRRIMHRLLGVQAPVNDWAVFASENGDRSVTFYPVYCFAKIEKVVRTLSEEGEKYSYRETCGNFVLPLVMYPGNQGLSVPGVTVAFDLFQDEDDTFKFWILHKSQVLNHFTDPGAVKNIIELAYWLECD